MSQYTYIVYHSSSYPEDGYYEGIIKYFDNKHDAYEYLINYNSDAKLNMYQNVFIREFENDFLYDEQKKIKKYYARNVFITDISNNNIYYCKDNNKELINKNLDYLTKFNQVENLSNELNKLYQEHYDLCMIKYYNKEIKHPILRKYNLNKYSYLSLSHFPFQQEDLEKNEFKLSSVLEDIIKRQNEIHSI